MQTTSARGTLSNAASHKQPRAPAATDEELQSLVLVLGDDLTLLGDPTRLKAYIQSRCTTASVRPPLAGLYAGALGAPGGTRLTVCRDNAGLAEVKQRCACRGATCRGHMPFHVGPGRGRVSVAAHALDHEAQSCERAAGDPHRFAVRTDGKAGAATVSTARRAMRTVEARCTGAGVVPDRVEVPQSGAQCLGADGAVFSNACTRALSRLIDVSQQRMARFTGVYDTMLQQCRVFQSEVRQRAASRRSLRRCAVPVEEHELRPVC